MLSGKVKACLNCIGRETLSEEKQKGKKCFDIEYVQAFFPSHYSPNNIVCSNCLYLCIALPLCRYL